MAKAGGRRVVTTPPAKKSASAPRRRAPKGSRAIVTTPSVPPRAVASSGRGVRVAMQLVTALVLVCIAAWCARWFLARHDGRGVAVRVAIPEPLDASTVSMALARAGVIDHPRLFAALIALTGTAGDLPHGALVLRDDLSPRVVLRTLAEGVGLIRVTIPEGSTRFDIAHKLFASELVPSEESFLARTTDPAALARNGLAGDSAEGFLFPDTYDFPTDATPDSILDRMVEVHRRRYADALARHPDGIAHARANGLDDRAIVTLASLVERETGASEDRPRVAAVFWNRLFSPSFVPHVLQTDPTIVYGCRVSHPPSCATAATTGRLPITRAMLDDAQNPYNTYKHAGLPPSPIANPGTRAFDAVLAPASTGDLYFVARGDGRSAFATTRAEHEANVQRYLRNPARDAGAP